MSHSIYRDFCYFIASMLVILTAVFSILHQYSQELRPENFLSSSDLYDYVSTTTPQHKIYQEILKSSSMRAQHEITPTHTTLTAHTSSHRI